MSYRSIKRLLGETSLERKCRLLLGGGIFLLVLVSFFFYGYQTEKLVWEETKRTAELLVNPVLLRSHSAEKLLAEEARRAPAERKPAAPKVRSLADAKSVDMLLPENVEEYQSQIGRAHV